MTLSSQEKHIFYSFHTFAHIRQHYFLKYWVGRMHGPSLHLKLWGDRPPVPPRFPPLPFLFLPLPISQPLPISLCLSFSLLLFPFLFLLLSLSKLEWWKKSLLC